MDDHRVERWARRIMYRSGDALVNERKASFRSGPGRHIAIATDTHVLAISGLRIDSPGLAELGRRVGRTLSRLFRDEAGMGYAGPAPSGV